MVVTIRDEANHIRAFLILLYHYSLWRGGVPLTCTEEAVIAATAAATTAFLLLQQQTLNLKP